MERGERKCAAKEKGDVKKKSRADPKEFLRRIIAVLATLKRIGDFKNLFLHNSLS